MIDGIIKADGTSRAMRATLPATYEEFKSQAALGNVLLDILYNATGWSQKPTFLNKANLLTDATASLFGLGEGAVPDEIISFIGQYNKHWWSRVGAVAATYQLGTEVVDAKVTSSGYVADIYYSDNIVVADDGTISLAEPIRSFEVVGRDNQNTGEELKNLNAIKGKFFYKPNGTSTLHVPTNTILYRTNTTDAYFDSGCYVSVRPVYGIPATTDGEVSYVNSIDRNAYPDSGEVGGLVYQYLGVPFQNAVTAPKIAYGSYTGTGTTSASKPMTLTFNFSPKFILIAPNSYMAYGDSSVHSEKYYVQIWMPGITETLFYKYNGNSTRYMSVDGNTFSFYQTISGNGGATGTLNASGKTYYYIALG